MDIIPLNNDFTFDSGQQPITTSAAQQKICRVQVRGRRGLASVIVRGGTIADCQLLQSAYPDDPNPLLVFDASGITGVALSNESYVLNPPTYPFGPGVFQVHLQGDAAELIFQASGASVAGVTVQVKGSCSKIGIT